MDTRPPPPPDATVTVPRRTAIRRAMSKSCASATGSAVFVTCSVIGAAVFSVGAGTILEQMSEFLDASIKKGFWTTLVAFVFSLVAILVLWLRERGLADQTAEKESYLQSQQNMMEDRLTSMPPKDFVYEYIMALRGAGELRMKSKHEAKHNMLTSEQVRDRIRSILSAVVILTRLWDGVSRIRDHVVYKANLMHVVIPEQLWEQPNPAKDAATPQAKAEDGLRSAGAGEPAKQTDDRLKTVPGERDPERPLYRLVEGPPIPFLLDTRSQRPAANDGDEEQSWDGWVVSSPFFLHRQNSTVAWERCTGALAIVDTELSVSSSGITKSGVSADHELEPIILPYTVKDKFDRTFHHPNLPGAPLAAATGQPAYIENISESIKNWIDREREDNPETNQRYLNDVAEYYKNLEGVSSLISIPVMINDRLNAVLNIQKNNESLLYSHERADMFIHLMNPICYHLGRMLLLMYEVDAMSENQEEAGDEPTRDGQNGTEG